MRNLIVLMSFVLSSACSAAPADSQPANEFDEVEQPEPLPSEIRGLWAESAKDCKDEYATSRMKVGANWIAFYESYGFMQISTQAGLPDLDQSLAVSFIMSGEGSTWTNELIFGWDKAKPKELFLIEAKTPESMMRERKRERYLKCN
jgi:hypothetical protein